MKKMIIIIDLHCDATMPSGAYEFGGGNKYSRNLITSLLSIDVPFIYITHKKMNKLEDYIELAPEKHFYRITLTDLGIYDKDLLQNYKIEIINLISEILVNFQNYKFVFHSIYWSSGEIASYFACQYATYFVHSVLSNGKRKILQDAKDDIIKSRCKTEQLIFNNATYIICSSKAEAEDINNLYKIDSKKIVISGRWVETSYINSFYDLYGCPMTHCLNNKMQPVYIPLQENRKDNNCNLSHMWSEQKAFIYVGRIHKDKGITQILEAWLSLYQKYREAVPPLWIIGGVPSEIDDYKQTYCTDKDIIVKAEQSYKLFWWGTLPPEGISTLMLKGMVLLTHSKYESGGNVILEAMAHSLPVIATPFGYAKHYIKSAFNGYLVKYNDTHSLQLHMEYFIKQPYLSNYMGRLAHSDLIEIINNWDFLGTHLELYGMNNIKPPILNMNNNKCIPIDSVDIYPYKLVIPDNLFVREIVKASTNEPILTLVDRKSNSKYLLWEITTIKQKYYFYYLYTILNRDCINNNSKEYLITKYKRVNKWQKNCILNNKKIYYINEAEGYILLDILMDENDA